LQKKGKKKPLRPQKAKSSKKTTLPGKISRPNAGFASSLEKEKWFVSLKGKERGFRLNGKKMRGKKGLHDLT